MALPASCLFGPGDVIDCKYRVEQVLGSGGMGVVLAAKHLALESPVALKVLHAKLQRVGVIRERFLREARAAASLRSRHVAKTIDVGTDPSGTPYIVMERLFGEDLECFAKRVGAAPEAVAIDYLIQACDAVGEAHAVGIVHRDLKPENLFLAEDFMGHRSIRVLDFGISKSALETKQLTATAEVMGTPHFMSPEQFRSTRDVTARTDVWALGAILYRLASGVLPFDGASFPELCQRILLEPPPPLESLRPGLSPDFCALVRRCLEKDAALRFANAYELGQALESVRDRSRANHRVAMAATVGVPAYVPPPPPVEEPIPRRRRRRYTLLAMPALVLVGLLGLSQRSAAREALAHHGEPTQTMEATLIDPPTMPEPAATQALAARVVEPTPARSVKSLRNARSVGKRPSL